MICTHCGFDNLTASAKQLTRREAQIVSYLIKGQSNMQIADALIISERTVKFHVSKLFAKLGIHKRSQLVYLWYSKQLDADSIVLVHEFIV